MAHTAHKNPKKEKFEAPEVINRKAKALAELIRRSEHFVVFTGAGISTSAGSSLSLIIDTLWDSR